MIDGNSTEGPPRGGTPSVWALKRCAKFLRQFQADLRHNRPREEALEDEELNGLEDHLHRVIAFVPQFEPEYKLLVAFGASLNFISFIGMADDQRIAYRPVPEVTCGRVANSGGKIASLLEDLAEAYGGTAVVEPLARSRATVSTVRLGTRKS